MAIITKSMAPEHIISINETTATKENEDILASKSIYRVPLHIRRISEDSYNPKVVSIGPIHHNDPNLQSMEHHKTRILLCLLQSSNLISTIHTLIEAANKDLEKSARACYSDSFENMETGDFLQMLILDGFFILQLLCLHNQGEVSDPIFQSRWMLPAIREDLLLLENQIPYFVLLKLFDLTSKFHGQTSLLKLIFNFFDRVEYMVQMENSPFPDNLLGLIHSSYHSGRNHFGVQPNSTEQKFKKTTYSAVKLNKLGVHFKCNTGTDLLDIEHSTRKGFTLSIPPLVIDDYFIKMVRNFIVYEQCTKKVNPWFTSYAFFVDGLVDSTKDIKMLRRNKIIIHELGKDEEVVALLNCLPNKVDYDGSNRYLSSVIQDLVKFGSNRWNRWCAALKRNRFSNTQKVLAVMSTIMVLDLTFDQTLFTMLSYEKSKP